MPIGALTSYLDVAQVTLYAFWIFFFGLVIYLHAEDKREGYPLEVDYPDRQPRANIVGFPAMPDPKTFKLSHGGTAVQPNYVRDTREIKAVQALGGPGSPLVPTGDPMLDAIGPGSYAERADTPDLTYEGSLKIVPLRVATDHTIEEKDPDPRGMDVFGDDGKVGGVVTDVWVDRSEMCVRYLELAVPTETGSRQALLPINFARIGGGRVRVQSILAKHFVTVPVLRHPDQITLLEEDRICAYYGGGCLYAEPSRQEPWF